MIKKWFDCFHTVKKNTEEQSHLNDVEHDTRSSEDYVSDMIGDLSDSQPRVHNDKINAEYIQEEICSVLEIEKLEKTKVENIFESIEKELDGILECTGLPKKKEKTGMMEYKERNCEDIFE
jgi:hypothetical protein